MNTSSLVRKSTAAPARDGIDAHAAHNCRVMALAFGCVLKVRRTQLGLTAQELADRIQVNSAALDVLEGEPHIAALVQVAALAEALELPLHVLSQELMLEFHKFAAVMGVNMPSANDPGPQPRRAGKDAALSIVSAVGAAASSVASAVSTPAMAPPMAMAASPLAAAAALPASPGSLALDASATRDAIVRQLQEPGTPGPLADADEAAAGVRTPFQPEMILRVELQAKRYWDVIDEAMSNAVEISLKTALRLDDWLRDAEDHEQAFIACGKRHFPIERVEYAFSKKLRPTTKRILSDLAAYWAANPDAWRSAAATAA